MNDQNVQCLFICPRYLEPFVSLHFLFLTKKKIVIQLVITVHHLILFLLQIFIGIEQCYKSVGNSSVNKFNFINHDSLLFNVIIVIMDVTDPNVNNIDAW